MKPKRKRSAKLLREDWLRYLNLYGKGSPEERQAYREYVGRKQNENRRERHQAMLNIGLVRVRGSLGGVYYE